MLRRATLCATVVVLTMIGTYAETPDGACDGLEGNAWGLCNAYCYAMDCYGAPNASDQACEQVLGDFSRATEGQRMPCEETESQLGSCPCNFDLQFWTSQPQILPSSSLPMCSGTGGSNTCITCTISSPAGLNTYLGVLVNLFTDGIGVEEDSLFFFTTDPSSPAGGTCVADTFFGGSGATFTTEGGKLPLTSEQLSACLSDIGALKSAYVHMCSR